MNFETIAIRTQSERTHQQEHSVPLYLTSSFTFDSAEQGQAIFQNDVEGNLYSRFSNPNNEEFIQKLCRLGNYSNGVSTASGMAAVYTTFAALLKQGDHIVASKNIFGNALYIITQILPNMGIEYTLVEVEDKEAWQKAVKSNTKVAYLETPGNPTLKIADLDFFSKLCRKHEIISIVDNCFATPYLQRPSDFDIDISIHSATKYIDGQGRVLGGAILGNEEHIVQCFNFLRRTGACLSPFNAWILSKSIETLAIRMNRHCANALAIAEWLENHSKVNRVIYPFLDSHPQHLLAKRQMRLGGGIVGLEINGSKEDSMNFLNQLKIHSLTANLGDTRSIATHPASTTHSKLSNEEQLEAGIQPNYLRFSVGLENIEDLINDIDQALNSIQS
jgi:O-succinylhomoserine sulfhydrylase